MKRKKYLWEHPSGRWYIRKNGNYTRIFALYGTPEFDYEYWEILRGKRAEKNRFWSVLMDDLRKSKKWAGFSIRYRGDLEPVMLYLDERIGKRDVSRLTPVDIYGAMDANEHRVNFANYIPVTLSLLAKLARRKGWRRDNPAAGIEKLEVPEERKKPHIAWPDKAVKNEKKGQGLARLIFEIGIGSVQRPGDWVDFVWGDFDGSSLRLKQNKTGVELLLPCTRELKKELLKVKAALPDGPNEDRPILAKADGSAMSCHTMARIMRKERERLGFTQYDLHALRDTP